MDHCSPRETAQTVHHLDHVAGKAAFLWLVSCRRGFGTQFRCVSVNVPAFPALDPLAAAGEIALCGTGFLSIVSTRISPFSVRQSVELLAAHWCSPITQSETATVLAEVLNDAALVWDLASATLFIGELVAGQVNPPWIEVRTTEYAALWRSPCCRASSSLAALQSWMPRAPQRMSRDP